jgi:biopolymer transport protein ExbD
MALKRKKSRIGIVIDMTPMVDISFLLVIFFMATYHARAPETVQINMPLSRSPFKVPESDVMVLSILPPARQVALAESINPTEFYATMQRYREAPANLRDGLAAERAVAELIMEKASVDRIVMESRSLTPDQIRARAESLAIWWNLGRDAAVPIPVSDLASTLNRKRFELAQNRRLMRLVIKADKDIPSGMMLDIMNILQDPNVNMFRFSLVTLLKTEEAGEGGGT